MKTRNDLVQGLLRKAESDLANAELCLEHGISLDTACFHAQQCAEKVLKAYLTSKAATYSFTHNLEKLIDACIVEDRTFDQLIDEASALTPYAVGLRYDDEFWPSEEDAAEAVAVARKIKAFVETRL